MQQDFENFNVNYLGRYQHFYLNRNLFHITAIKFLMFIFDSMKDNIVTPQLLIRTLLRTIDNNVLLGRILSPELVEKVLPKVGAGVNIPPRGNERIDFYRTIIEFIISRADEQSIHLITP